MNAEFQGGPLEGLTDPRDDWDRRGTPFDFYRTLPWESLGEGVRWHRHGPRHDPRRDGTAYKLDVDASRRIARYRWIPPT
jgi:hypothetical protein